MDRLQLWDLAKVHRIVAVAAPTHSVYTGRTGMLAELFN